MDRMHAYELYERAWNEPERAAALLADCFTKDGVYADDEVADGVVGPSALADLIAATHAEQPGFRVWATSSARMLAGRLAITWASEGGDPPIRQAGSDVIEFVPEGRISRITDVLDLD
ncbi:MAG TPA: hypothetical protein VFN41_11750 [Candidatus Limnocylindrales bacterium]|nr:hypothetical protein [Candidatus Limnocylindrales bacterium]